MAVVGGERLGSPSGDREGVVRGRDANERDDAAYVMCVDLWINGMAKADIRVNWWWWWWWWMGCGHLCGPVALMWQFGTGADGR